MSLYHFINIYDKKKEKDYNSRAFFFFLHTHLAASSHFHGLDFDNWQTPILRPDSIYLEITYIIAKMA